MQFSQNTTNFSPKNRWSESPFGVLLNERSKNGGKYRYGFNGMEGDNEVSGNGNSYDFGARMLNPRVGRFMSLDVYAYKYPDLSSYTFVANSPLVFVDPDGRDIIFTGTNKNKKSLLDKINSGGGTQFRITKSGELKKKFFSKVEGKFAEEIVAGIKDDQRVYLRLVNKDNKNTIDSYPKGTVDMADLLATDSDVNIKQNLLHIIVERFSHPSYELRKKVIGASELFDKYHEKALEAEEEFLREQYPGKTIKFSGEGFDNSSVEIDEKTNKGTVNYILNFGDVQMVIKVEAIQREIEKTVPGPDGYPTKVIEKEIIYRPSRVISYTVSETSKETP